MSTKHLLRSFAGGEITPELAGRLDLTKYQTGLSLARNFITLPHGPATRRPGFEFINEAYNVNEPVRLIPFQFSADQSVVLEFGNQYVRFHINGGTVLEPAKGIGSVVGSVVTTVGVHGYSSTDWVYIGGRYLRINVLSTTTFQTLQLDGLTPVALPGGIEVARLYTLATPYQPADLFDLKFAQSADIITITHPGYAARELARNAVADWTLTPVSFAAPTNWPTGLTVVTTITTPTNLSPQTYVVTTVVEDGVTESLACPPVSATNNLTLAGNYNTVSWSAVNGASRYNVYKKRGGVFGYIGQVRPSSASTPVNIATISRSDDDKTVTVNTTGAHGLSVGDTVLIQGTGVGSFDSAWVVTTVADTDTFTFESTKKAFNVSTNGTVSELALSLIDDNVLADTTQSPPEDIIALNGEAGDYPSATTYHERRRWFAGTTDKPQVLWATRTGTDSNLTSSLPTRDADGMELRIAAAQYNQIRHLVPLADLLALTAGGEFRVYADGAPAITPTSVSIKPQGYAGASNVQPVVTSSSVLYVQAQGARVRELAYNWESNSYRSVDASIMAPHRFNGHTIIQLAYSRAPDQIAWAVRDDGVLLGLTYVPDQQVFAWHAHDTDGLFESICVVSEGNEDVLYAVVKRTVNTRPVRYIERLRTRIFTAASAAFFVDSGLTYSGTATSTITGLFHLEGKSVDIVADGAVHPRKTVAGGQVVLDFAASTVHIGLPITADLRTLPLALESAQAAGQGTVKNVNKVHMRVSQSSVLKAGPAFDRLREYPARAVSDPYGSPPELRDGELSLSVDPSWNQDAAICVRQDLPLPLTVLSMTLEIQTGG